MAKAGVPLVTSPEDGGTADKWLLYSGERGLYSMCLGHPNPQLIAYRFCGGVENILFRQLVLDCAAGASQWKDAPTPVPISSKEDGSIRMADMGTLPLESVGPEPHGVRCRK